ncbi:MAG: hypothetical protein ACXW27_07395 [Allosphingosinicella sp.]
MPRYLLSSQAFLDICRRQGKPAEKWLERVRRDGVDARDVCISAVAPMNALGLIAAMIARERAGGAASKALPHLRRLETNVREFVRDLAEDDCIVPMDHHIAEQWGVLLDTEIAYVEPDGRSEEIGSAAKLEIATAIVGRHGIPFTYVIEEQAAYADLPGLLLESP